MVNSFLSTHKTKYRITLELDVLDDFNPRDINWEQLFELQDTESISTYVEDLSVSWITDCP